METIDTSLPASTSQNFQVGDSLKEWKKYEKVHLVMGNEACDLDSAVSAFVYARFLASKVDDSDVLVCSVLNTTRDELRLKTEVEFLFHKTGFSLTDFPTRDECPIDEMFLSGKLELTLVDHNVLAHKDAELEGSVVEIIDHHTLDRTKEAHVDLTVEPVGSCCTLITGKILQENENFITSQLAALLQGTILLDTVNLSETAKRATPKDKAMVDYLEKFLGQPDRETIFNAILEAKVDVSSLTWQDLLRRDVKILKNERNQIAIASVPMLVQDYLTIYQEVNDDKFYNYCQKFGYSALVVMGIEIGSAVKRDLAVFSRDVGLARQINEALQQSNTPSLELKAFNQCMNRSIQFLTHYEQQNYAASRKVVLPVLNYFLKKKSVANTIVHTPFQE